MTDAIDATKQRHTTTRSISFSLFQLTPPPATQSLPLASDLVCFTWTDERTCNYGPTRRTCDQWNFLTALTALMSAVSYPVMHCVYHVHSVRQIMTGFLDVADSDQRSTLLMASRSGRTEKNAVKPRNSSLQTN